MRMRSSSPLPPRPTKVTCTSFAQHHTRLSTGERSFKRWHRRTPASIEQVSHARQTLQSIMKSIEVCQCLPMPSPFRELDTFEPIEEAVATFDVHLPFLYNMQAI